MRKNALNLYNREMSSCQTGYELMNPKTGTVQTKEEWQGQALANYYKQ